LPTSHSSSRSLWRTCRPTAGAGQPAWAQARGRGERPSAPRLETDAHRVYGALDQEALVRVAADRHGGQQQLGRVLDLHLGLAVALHHLRAEGRVSAVLA